MTVEQAPVLSEAGALAGVPASSVDTSGLRHGVLSPVETLAQSISTIAPTASPTLTVPLVFALAGNGTWLAYVIATLCILLIALCVGYYARISASCGSLYGFALSAKRPAVSATVGLAMVLAYAATGASVVGGFINYANVLVDAAGLPHLSAMLLAAARGSAQRCWWPTAMSRSRRSSCCGSRRSRSPRSALCSWSCCGVRAWATMRGICRR